MTAEDRIRALLPTVRRYSVSPGVLFAVPSTLAEVCAYLGFRNRCERGKVYVTPTKIARLTALGLPAPLTGGRPDEHDGRAVRP